MWVGNIEEEYSLILKCKLFISLVKCTVYVSRAAAGWKPVFILCNSLKVLTKLRPRTMYLSLCSTVDQNVKNLITVSVKASELILANSSFGFIYFTVSTLST